MLGSPEPACHAEQPAASSCTLLASTLAQFLISNWWHSSDGEATPGALYARGLGLRQGPARARAPPEVPQRCCRASPAT